MIRFEKKIMQTMIIGLVVFFLLSIPSFALVWGNNTQGVFGSDGKGEGESINGYIIDGAGYFLKAYSDILLFLNKIELAETRGLNFAEINAILDSAIDNMERVKSTYAMLCEKADATPYDQTVIEQLKTFDYISFQEQNALNPVIFREVKLYMASGNIRGAYYKILSATEKILGILKGIEKSTADNIFPPVPDLWKLNQACSNIFLFGQYLSMVFNALTNG
jgi:hypothetical protein